MTRRAVGLCTEARAAAYLRRRGLRLIARNFSCKFGELDLIMRHGDALVFVEVRGRTSSTFMSPAASIDPRKQRRLALTATFFLKAKPQYACLPARFDVVAVTGPNYRPTIEWIQDAFALDDCAGL